MVRIRVEEVINQLEPSLRASLRDAVKEVMPDALFDDHDLFFAFKRSVARRCKRWERVSDRFVDFD